jgi:hypothetical protein
MHLPAPTLSPRQPRNCLPNSQYQKLRRTNDPVKQCAYLLFNVTPATSDMAHSNMGSISHCGAPNVCIFAHQSLFICEIVFSMDPRPYLRATLLIVLLSYWSLSYLDNTRSHCQQARRTFGRALDLAHSPLAGSPSLLKFMCALKTT